MATPKSMKNFRSWSSLDSVDPNDVRRLYDPETSSTSPAPRCISTWTFSLIALIISVFFLIGLFVGFYIRDNQSLTSVNTPCDYRDRSDGFDEKTVQLVHENIMYFMSGEEIRKTTRQLQSSSERTTNSAWDKQTINYIERKFKGYGLDKVEVHHHNVVVSHPDPERPSVLTVMQDGNTHLNVTFSSTDTVTADGSKRNHNSEIQPPHVAFSSSGRAMGILTFGNYGSRRDLMELKNMNISLRNSILLLRLGKISVYEKIRLATKVGAKAVLLYIDPADSTASKNITPTVSSVLDTDGPPLVPAQTVSVEVAKQLLKLLSNSGVIAPDSWQGGINEDYYMGLKKENKELAKAVMVELTVNAVPKTERVSSVIGSIYGNMETDRFVVIGTSRTAFPVEETDIALGTAHLLEMARSFTHIKTQKKWGPRRGVRFCSWGGSELSQEGMKQYLKRNEHIFGKQTVAYIDLDLFMEVSAVGSSGVEVSSGPALWTLLNDVLHEVPDSNDNQMPLSDKVQKRSLQSDGFNQDDTVLSVMQQHGVPIIKAGYRFHKDNQQNLIPVSEVVHDSDHHDKYHLAAARVMSLASLRLIDDEDLPFNVINFTKFIHDAVARSSLDIMWSSSKIENKNLISNIDNLTRTGRAFEEYVNSHLHTKIPLESRRMNDIKMGLDDIFVSPEKYRSTSPLLYNTAIDGSLLLVKEALITANSSNDWQEVSDILEKVNTAIEEVIRSLHLS